VVRTQDRWFPMEKRAGVTGLLQGIGADLREGAFLQVCLFDGQESCEAVSLGDCLVLQDHREAGVFIGALG